MASITSGELQTFRSEFAGTVITPADPAFADARAAAVWNGDIQRRPALIARCAGAGDVAAALRFARRRAGADGARRGPQLRRVRRLRRRADDRPRRVELGHRRLGGSPRSVRGGATWGDVDAATQAHGLAVPGGVVSTTGIGGLTLGGGIGWLSRRHGLSADNLLAAEVVTADGRLLRASADEHADLFWALRGGAATSGSSPPSSTASTPSARRCTWGSSSGAPTRAPRRCGSAATICRPSPRTWGPSSPASAPRRRRSCLSRTTMPSATRC